MQNSSDLRSTLSRAKGLGAAHHGVSHWWWQRVTAVALVPLLVWFLYALVTLMLTPDVTRIAEWLASPLDALAMVLMLAALFVHAKLGMQVVIEDYVHTPALKYTLLLLVAFLCFAFASAGIIAVLRLHFLDITSASL